MTYARGRVEIVANGIDESLQLIGGDAFGRLLSVGLRVPFAATNVAAKAPGIKGFPGPIIGRYLFLIATFSISYKQKARIRGYRMGATIGAKQISASGVTPRVIEREIESPMFKFQDGNISWHLMDVGAPNAQGYNPLRTGPNDLDNFIFRWSSSPALLYETATLPAGDPFYVDLTAYKPPWQGRPPGTTLLPQFNTMYDLRTPYRTSQAWNSLDIPLEGPRTVAFFASVRQTNPATRAPYTPPAGLTPEEFYSLGISQEEQFILENPPVGGGEIFPFSTGAIYWRVMGSLIVDFD
jgi:hypothetical protein